jgi:endonuclease YncB( thermonuclease family)
VKLWTTDRFGRTVARVACDGIDASAEQARAGMAGASCATRPTQFVGIEQDAREAQRRRLTASGAVGVACGDERSSRHPSEH